VRKIAGVVSERCEALLQVERHRVVDLGADARRFELRAHVVSLLETDYILVEDVLAIGGPCGQRNGVRQAGIGEEPAIPLGVAPAQRTPLPEVRQLDAQHRRLQGVEPEVAADAPVEVLGVGAMVPQQPDLLRQWIVVRRDESAVAECTEVLAGKEREAPDRAHRSGLASLVGRANGLRCILDDGNPGAPRSFEHRIEVGAEAVQVNRNQRTRP